MRSWLIRLSAIPAFLIVLSVIAGATSAHAAGSPVPSAADALKATISLKTVTVGSDPQLVLYDPANDEVYVSDTGSDTVSVVNSTTYAVTTISVGKEPEILTYGASNKDVYVENFDSNNVSVISSANKVVHTVKLPGLEPFSQIYDPANGDVYVVTVDATGFEISDINHQTWALKNVTLSAGYSSVAYDNASSSLVVASGETNELTVINATDVATTVKLTTGIFPDFMVYNPDDKDMYIADLGESSKGLTKTGNVSVLASDNKIIKTLKVGQNPTLGTYDPANHDIYQVNTGNISKKPYPSSTVSVIGTSNTVLKTITVGKFAVEAAYDPKNTEMYLPCAGSNKTYAINSTTNAIAATITTTQYADGAGYDPALGDMLAAGLSTFLNSSSTAKTIVTVIPSSNKGTSTVTLGPGPLAGAAYDPKDSGFWGANHGDTVSVIL